MNSTTDFDLGPLTWVKGEIDLALGRAAEALHQFQEQGDSTQLKFCRTHLHQVHGALSMVGLDGVTRVSETLEGLLKDMESGDVESSESVLQVVQDAFTALSRYLEDLVAGEPNQPLRLLPTYRALAAAWGDRPANATDLFFPDLGLRPPKRPAPAPMTQDERAKLIRSQRGSFQKGLLAWLREPEGSEASQNGLATMQAALRRIESTQVSPSARSFWWASLGLVTALMNGASRVGDARSLCARVDLQIRRLLEGNPGVAERLLRDALYFVAHTPAQADPLLAEIQSAYQLDALVPTADQLRAMGRTPHETALRRLREAVDGAEDQWNRFCSGSASALNPFVDQARNGVALANELGQADLTRLAGGLVVAANWLAEDPSRHSDGVAMEVATVLLLIQTALENYNRLGADFTQQVNLMVDRLRVCMDGGVPSDTEIPLLDEMSRRAQERLLMTQVAREIQSNLGQIEQALDTYFRDTSKRPDAASLETPLRQISGALTILGQDAAVTYLKSCEQNILAFSHSDGEPGAEAFEDVAHQLSTLGFFVEALQHGNVEFNAFRRKLEGERKEQVEDEPEEEEQFIEPPVVSVENQLAQLKAETRSLLDALKNHPGDAALHESLQAHLKALQKDADLVADQALVSQVKAALTALATPEKEEAPRVQAVEAALAPIHEAPQVSAPSAETLHLAQATTEELDAELLSIFLEEAQEVLGTIGENLAVLRVQPHNVDTLTTIRRSAHTLKGSGRMVGLKDLGETAWAVEQTLNLWLRQEQEVTPELLGMITLTHEVFSAWVEHLALGDKRVPDAGPLIRMAEHLRGEDSSALPVAPAVADAVVPVAEVEEHAVQDETVVLGSATNFSGVDFSFAALGLESTGVEEVVEADVKEEPPVSFDNSFLATEILNFPLDSEEMHDDPEATVVMEGFQFASDDSDPLAELLDLGSEREPALPEVDKFSVEDVPEAVVEQEPVEELPEISVALDVDAPEVVSEAPSEAADLTEVSLDTESSGSGQTIKISPQLYEIFRDEAQGHMDALHQFVHELGLAPTMETSFPSSRAAHTLAGIAGTVGIVSLNKVGKALEGALLRRNSTAHPDSLEGQEILRQTVDMLEAMLAQLSEGIMPEEQPALVDALNQLYPAGPEGESVFPDLAEVTPGPEAEFEGSVSVGEDVFGSGFTEDMEEEEELLPQDLPPVLQDELDEQLLPIFLEEAQDLIAGFHKQIGAWKENRADRHASDALSRLLHTFKGSARMAGAMNLGQLTHAIESRVGELVSSGEVNEADLEEIQEACDLLAHGVERLQAGDLGTSALLELEAEQASSGVADVLVPQAEEKISPSVPVVTTPAPTVAQAVPHQAVTQEPVEAEALSKAVLRVRTDLVDQLASEAGELSIARARIEGEMRELKDSLLDLTENVIRLRRQLREIEIQAETQIQAGSENEVKEDFDPLELDRFTRFQELTRMMAESVNDVGTVQQSLLKNLDDANAALIAQARLNRSLQQSLMSVRMVPFSSQGDRLYRLVRQTAKGAGKRANLEIHGSQVELDRSVLEKVLSPLEHMLRNAVVHGLESGAERLEAGKAEIGEINLNVVQEGNEIILSLSDDGRGLDLERIRAKAVVDGLLGPDEVMEERRLVDIIFRSGFSTATEVSQVAGRGVGMDVVKTEITALGGRIEILTEQGKGTTFRLYLPLTLAVTQAVMVTIRERLFAIPSTMVDQVMEVREKVLDEMFNKGEVVWQGNQYPFHYLPRLLGDVRAVPEVKRLNWVLLLRSGAQRVAIHVDSLLGNQEIVVKNVGPQMARVVGISGATVLGDGRVVLILNPVALASLLPGGDAGTGLVMVGAPVEAAPEAPPVKKQPTILVVDDSLTVRKITSRLLAREGYQVEVAKDGVDALEQLIESIPDVILSDIEMPRMDGFDLVRNIRADERLVKVPIIMITSRTADKHRKYAMEIGANHYLGKPYNEEELLGLIARYTKA